MTMIYWINAWNITTQILCTSYVYSRAKVINDKAFAFIRCCYKCLVINAEFVVHHKKYYALNSAST